MTQGSHNAHGAGWTLAASILASSLSFVDGSVLAASGAALDAAFDRAVLAAAAAAALAGVAALVMLRPHEIAPGTD